MPPVVVTLPNSSTEPPASVVTDAAATLLPNFVRPELFTVTPASEFVPPKASLKVTPPDPAVTVKPRAALLVALSTTLSKLTAPSAFVAVRAVSAPRVSALPKLCAPVVFTEPPLSSVVLPLPLTVSEAKALNAPTAPPNVVVPLPVTVRARAEPLSLSTFWFRAISVPVRTVSRRTKTSPL